MRHNWRPTNTRSERERLWPATQGVQKDGFHTVNSIEKRSEPIMRLILAAGARPDVRLAGITWGKGYPWETTFFDVTPVS